MHYLKLWLGIHMINLGVRILPHGQIRREIWARFELYGEHVYATLAKREKAE